MCGWYLCIFKHLVMVVFVLFLEQGLKFYRKLVSLAHLGKVYFVIASIIHGTITMYLAIWWFFIYLKYWHCLWYCFGRSVFWALFGAIYLCFGLPEVYRVLFEVFGMDPDAEDCQPKLRRQLEDVDYVSVEFDTQKLNWQDVAAYKAIIYSFLFL